MPNGEPAYTVIAIHTKNLDTCKDARKRIQGYAYLKMSAADYIKSIPKTYQQYNDSPVDPDDIPVHLDKVPKKRHKQNQDKRNKLLYSMCRERQINFVLPSKITKAGFLHGGTNLFKWAKNPSEARDKIIHDTTNHLHFESKNIIDSISKSKNNENLDNDTESTIANNGDAQSESDSDGLDTEDNKSVDSRPHGPLFTAEELESSVIKDHLELLKRWQREDTKTIGKEKWHEIIQLKNARKTGLSDVRWFERLNELKKCYIVTKSENILPFKLTVPTEARQKGNIYYVMTERLKWVVRALPNAEFALIQPFYNKNDKNNELNNFSGYIYLSMSAKMCLNQINEAKNKSNPMIWRNRQFNKKVKGDMKVWFPTCPTDPTTPIFNRPIEEIKNELINSKELPPAHFASLEQLHKLTDPDLKKVFRLVPKITES